MQAELDFSKPLIHRENNPGSQAHFEANKQRFTKQCRTVYNALLRGERLTTRIAMFKYNIMDLRRRIKDLKDTWLVPVESQYVQGGHKEYYLENNV